MDSPSRQDTGAELSGPSATGLFDALPGSGAGAARFDFVRGAVGECLLKTLRVPLVKPVQGHANLTAVTLRQVRCWWMSFSAKNGAYLKI